MTGTARERMLKLGVAVVAGLFLLDRLVLGPVVEHWKEQGERIETLQEKVKRGHVLLDREASLRQRWAEMGRGNLPAENAAAEDLIYRAINRWAQESKIGFNSLLPQWRTFEGYETYECRAAATGDQASLARLLYELEVDPLPVRLEECELSTRDKTGKQLTLTMRFSFVRLAENGGGR